MSSAILPPGPRGHFILGNLLEFRRDNLAFYSRCFRDYEDIVSFRLGPRLVVQLNHPDLIEYVLVTANRTLNKNFFAMRHLHPVLGSGLITSESDFWLRQRRLAQPAFHRDRIAAYGAVMVAYAERILADWRHGETRDIHADMMRFTLEIAAKTLFDVEVAGAARDVGAAFTVVQEIFSSRFESLMPLPVWIPTPANRRLRKAVRQLDALIKGLIQQRRASRIPGHLSRSNLVRDYSCSF